MVNCKYCNGASNWNGVTHLSIHPSMCFHLCLKGLARVKDLGRGCYNRRFQNPGIAKIGLTPHPPILAHWWISRQKVRKCDSRQWIKRAYSKILAKDCSKSRQKIVQIHQKNLGMGQTTPFWAVPRLQQLFCTLWILKVKFTRKILAWFRPPPLPGNARILAALGRVTPPLKHWSWNNISRLDI